jgi:hypothetical protein
VRTRRAEHGSQARTRHASIWAGNRTEIGAALNTADIAGIEEAKKG